jgi:hypothetical protein
MDPDRGHDRGLLLLNLTQENYTIKGMMSFAPAAR